MSAETCSASGIAVREAAPAERVDGVDLVHDELARQLVGTDLVQHGVDGRDLLDERSSDADPSTTWSTRSATSVSSSVAAKPSTS